MRQVVMLGSLLVGVALFSFACGGDDDGGDGGDQAQIDGGGATGEAPDISQVAWVYDTPCTLNQPSDVVVTVTVTDADTAAGDLTFSGSVAGCNPAVSSNPATLTCPNAAPYDGTITVTDPESNSDSQAITINPCADGQAP